tara:strand:+ start:1 stop:900 length:900 start_codon:yes stop_codon:yes gene_type:complete
MSTNPNAGLQNSIQGRLEGIQKNRSATSASDKLAKEAEQALRVIGTSYPDISQAIQGGFMSGKEGVVEAMKRRKDRKIIKGADDYNYYEDDQSRVLGDVKATPKTGQTINIGGETQTAGRKKVDEAYATDFLQWTQGGGADMVGQLAQIGTVLGQLEAGEPLTGPTIGMLGTYAPMALSIINPKAANAKEQVEEVVQRNLRIVLGAQFTAKEGANLISRAYNPALPPKQNASRLRKLFMQMEASAKQRDAMSSYFGKNGTLIGYEGKQPSINDFYGAIGDTSSESGNIPTWNPETGRFE